VVVGGAWRWGGDEADLVAAGLEHEGVQGGGPVGGDGVLGVGEVDQSAAGGVESVFDGVFGVGGGAGFGPEVVRVGGCAADL
jgi:hypothetical protein